jgi:chitosanase
MSRPPARGLPGYARKRVRTGLVVLCAASAVLAGCAGGDGRDGRDEAAPAEPWPAATTGPSDVTLTPVQRRVADQILSVFENTTTEPRYDYVEELRDGRGFTCGKIGFTTSSTEVRDVVEAYAARRPDSPLARHLPRLRELAATGSGAVDGLAGFAQDWAGAAPDPDFRAAQDALADRIAFGPALAAARRLGIRTPLGVTILYDTAVQHGMGNDPDGQPALVARATETAGGAPADGVDERRWLTAFLDVRADNLRRPTNVDTRKVWAASVDRVEALRRLVADNRHQLAPPLEITVFGDRYAVR